MASMALELQSISNGYLVRDHTRIGSVEQHRYFATFQELLDWLVGRYAEPKE